MNRSILPLLLLGVLLACSDGARSGNAGDLDGDFKLDAPRPTILLIDAAGDVSRMLRLDPDADEAVVVRPELAASARGLTIDRTEGILYWASREGDRIQMGRWNDASISDLPVAGLDSAYAIEYVAERDALYWSDYGTNAIHRVRLGGGEVETLIPGIEAPRQIAIDLVRERIYWVDRGRGAVYEASLDGPPRRRLAFGFVAPYGIVMDPTTHTLLVADAELGAIYRLDPITQDLSMWLREAGTHPSFLAVDTATSILYWTDNRDNVVRRRALSGGPVEVVAEGLEGPRGLVLVR
ncbi:MAG: hypothetical protein RQ745_05345 [Longimicrobiales bacterium]|nr:hypothetical protein [Longimicrobiales bacterium]